MATFATANAPLNPPDPRNKSEDEPTSSTPRPQSTETATKTGRTEESETDTPTVDNFGGVAGQRPLPDEPLTPARPEDKVKDLDGSLKRDVSQREGGAMESADVDMGDDGENDGADDDDMDNESVTSESQRPSKKKKGQRFFCTEFPPCQLSFTRSEHLARHIRKHTGERPFQCHCSRRFSRLDNLRQHAQTVHVNEEIPGDSLAATSTRFQRQIRTDRVRPPPNRPRASTISSQGGGGHSRGHSRNVSTSSIGSTTSSLGTPEDTRRRPQPLAMANDPAARARPTLDTYNSMTGSEGQQYAMYAQSPTRYSTPTSQTSFNGPGSPHFSAMGSPPSSISRSSFYNGARHAPGRRLSVPSAAHPYPQHMQPGPYAAAPAYFSPIPSGSSATFSQSGSMFGSPTSSVFSHGRRDSETELEYRRRTWHPGTYGNYSQRPATSGLSYHQTPDDQRPAPSTQPAASQVTRLPGIESFDHAPQRQPSPMMVDARPPSSHRTSDAGLHQGITRLDITAANAPVEGQWQAVHPVAAAQPGYFTNQPPPQGTVAPQFIHHSHSHSMPEPITPRKNKRHAWYGGGPVSVQQQQQMTSSSYMSHRPSPEDSGSSDGVPTPLTSQGTEYHPVIVNPSGVAVPEGYVPVTSLTEEQKVQYSQHQYGGKPSEPVRADSGIHTFRVDAAPAQQQTYALQAGQGYPPPPGGYEQNPTSNDMGRLEALVAVATSEGRAVENRP